MADLHVSPERELQWQQLVAVAVVAGDVTARAIARYAGVSMATAEWALDQAELSEVLVDGVISPGHAIALRASLDPERVTHLHAAVAGHVVSEGPGRLLEAIDHARAAGDLFPVENLTPMAEHAARVCMSVGDFESAQQLLEFVDDLTPRDVPTTRARRLLDLSATHDAQGRWHQARDLNRLAFEIAEHDGAGDLAAEAAIAYALPSDWREGDPWSTSMLQRVEALCPSHDMLVRLRAVRALIEMRVPVALSDDQQVGWITRPRVAQAMAHSALALSQDTSADTRLMALVAWRSTHRAPEHVEQRRLVSHEALDLAQRLRRHNVLADMAVMAAVDAMEMGDRPEVERMQGMLTWLAQRVATPRIRWQAEVLAACCAHIDGHHQQAQQHRTAAREIGQRLRLPGWLAADLTLAAQEPGEFDDDAARLAARSDESDQWASPLALAVHGLRLAQLGQREAAEQLVRRGLTRLDDESDLLLSATRLAEAALVLDVADVRQPLLEVLTPWAHHLAVDGHGWWCDGPVALWIAELHDATGHPGQAAQG